MKIEDIKQVISGCCNDVVFEYNGLKSGVTSEVYNSVPVFQAWHGENTREYVTLEGLLNDQFFSGKSILELIHEVEFDFV